MGGDDKLRTNRATQGTKDTKDQARSHMGILWLYLWGHINGVRKEI